MRITIPKLRTWHLLGIVAATAAFLSVMQFRWSVEDPGYALIRKLRSSNAAERAKAAGELIWIRPSERRAIAPLTEMLFDPDARVRATAARALLPIVRAKGNESEIGPVKAALASALGDRDPVARLAIARALGYLGGEPKVVVPTLLEFTKSPDEGARAEAVSILSQFGRESEPALTALFAALDDSSYIVRWRSLDSLTYCLARPTLAREPLLGRIKAALIGATDDEAFQVRATAVRGLGDLASLTRTEVPRVIEALSDPDADVRLRAAFSLGWRSPGKRSPALLPALELALKDEDSRVRLASATTLGYLRAESALPSLRASANDPQDEVRLAVDKAIKVIEKSARDFRSIILPGAIADLGNADPAVRALAATRLEVLGPKAAEAVPALVGCLADREADVRRTAATALGQLGPKAAVAVPNLSALAESDVDERVRRAASLSRSILLREGDGKGHAPREP